jgi:hypothetical protein
MVVLVGLEALFLVAREAAALMVGRVPRRMEEPEIIMAVPEALLGRAEI